MFKSLTSLAIAALTAATLITTPVTSFAQTDNVQSRKMKLTKKEMPAEESSSNVLSSNAYPLSICAVSGQKLGSMGDPIFLSVEGREVALCCSACEPKIKENPAQYFKKVDAQIIEQLKNEYPVDTCIVSGNALPAVDERAYHVDNMNRLYAFCCGGCAKTVAEDPEKWGEKLDQAIADAQRASYPLKTCIVSAEPIDIMGEPLEAVIGGQLYRFCCRGCASEVASRPYHYHTLLKKARQGTEIEQQKTPEEIHANDDMHSEEDEHAGHGH